jgi:hypothetical protein
VTTPDKFYFDEVHYVPGARLVLWPALAIVPRDWAATLASLALVYALRRGNSHAGCYGPSSPWHA